MNSSESGLVKSAGRTLSIMDLLIREEAMSFTDMLSTLGYPRSSLHGLLTTLVASGWLRFDGETKRYSLGAKIWEAGTAYASRNQWLAEAEHVLEAVRDATHETVQLAVLTSNADTHEVLYIAKVDGDQTLRLHSSAGRRLKPYATGVGKVLLSGLTDREFSRYLKGNRFERYTKNTITSQSKLRSEIKRVREQGFALDREERTVGASCVAVPVLDDDQHILAAISVSAPSVRFGRKEQKASLRQLQMAAERLLPLLRTVKADPIVPVD